MLRHAIGHARLMRESTERVEALANSGDGSEQWVARRVLESPLLWQQWESEHSGLMRQLADCPAREVQVSALKQTTLRLLHGKALFQFLKSRELRRDERAEILAHFRPGRSYESAVIAEHGVYLRKACSYLCANHLGTEVVHDAAFLDPMQRYEELYTEYFKLYCSSLVDAVDHVSSQRALLPLLKKQLHQYRLAILDPRRAQPFLRREAELRRPTGDTERLPSFASRPLDRR
jgi:predicted transcriptional regulator